MKKITKLIMRYSPLLLIQVLMSVGVSICVTRGNSIISTLVDDMLQGQAVFNGELVRTFVILVVAGFAASFIQRFSAGTFANKVCTDYRKLITDKLYTIQYQYICTNNAGTILNKIIGDISAIETLLDATFPEIISNLIATIVYAVYIATMNFRLFVLMIFSYPVIFWLANIFVKRVKKLTLVHRAKSDAMADISQSAVNGILIIRAFGLENLFKKKMEDAAQALVENEQKRQDVNNTAIITRQMLQWLPNIICAVYAAYMAGHGELSLGELLAFILILGRFVDYFVGLPFSFVDASMNIVSIDRIEDILSVKDERSGEYCGESDYSCENVIEFNNVSFSYDKENVLNGVNLTVSKQDDIAIIGESGGGKSTLVSLLCGFYDDFDGDIKVCGTSIREWNKEALRDSISLVSQDVFLFPMSIEENVSYGLTGATHEDIVMACREANIHEFIESLPEGYNTVIGERGTKLSGGQKQRLSIARAILKNAPIMIMDEPTSSIDVVTEDEIQKALEKVSANKTCITIAHRLNTIKHCNHVYELEHGKLAAKVVDAE